MTGIKATVPFDDLPDSAVVTGKATKHSPPSGQFDDASDSLVLEFRRETIADVRAKLADVSYDAVEIDDTRFSS